MKKALIPILLLIIAITAAIVIVCIVKLPTQIQAPIEVPVNIQSIKDATYTIEGESVTLKNGMSEIEAAPGSASKITTQYFGNELVHDFNADGLNDTAFILTQSSGGSGTFYYLVVAINTPEGYKGSDGYLLGDRIAPQNVEKGTGNIIVVNYADRKEGESFAESPSVGKSVWLLLDPVTMKLGVVEQNFEGEADPKKMSLTMKPWVWVSTTYNDGKVITPKDANKFKLTFTSPNRFSATTDCNGVGGEYKVNGGEIELSNMVSTLMFCEGSQEGDFTKSLREVQIFHFTSKGELVFDLKFDSGSMIFK